MPGHEFEKNVQQKLDELKIRPSEAVWKNVEKNIREEKRRRRMIIWLPILFLFLATGGYLIYTQAYVSTATAISKGQQEKGNDAKTPPKSIEETNQADAQNNNSTEQSLTKDLNDKLTKNNNANDKQSSRTSQASPSYSLTTIGTSNTINNSTIKRKDRIVVSNKPQEKFDPVIDQDNGLVVKDEEDLIDYSNPNLSLINGVAPYISIAIPEIHNDKIETPPVDESKLINPNTKDPYRSGKWQWGLDLAIGSSNSNTQLSLFKSAQMDASSGLGGNPGNPNANADKASTLEPGLYWAAGGFVQRNFSNWFSLSSGLKYAQYSTRIFTGSRVDSSRVFFNSGSFTTVNNYYRNGGANQYTNRYHFLELPVTMHAKLNKSNSFPFYANLGFSFSWLLATNSLNFDGTSGAYYQDIDLFNKTQFGMHGGFSFGALNKTRYPLRIGPSINYKLSPLMENSSSNKHLLSFGVDIRVLLKK